MTSERIEKTKLKIDYPSTWQEAPLPKGATSARSARAYFKKYPELIDLMGIPKDQIDEWVKSYGKAIVLFAADANHDGIRDGDNLIAGVFSHADQFHSLAEWKKAMRASANATHSEVLSDSETKVAGHQAFTHVERYPNGAVYATMDVNLDSSHVLDLSMTLDPGGESLAAQILKSVRPTG